MEQSHLVVNTYSQSTCSVFSFKSAVSLPFNYIDTAVIAPESTTTSVSTDCGPLTDPDNGQVDTSSGTTFGSVATFSCNTGYKLSHQQVVMCGADGMWSPDSSSCLGRWKGTCLYNSIMCGM